MWLLTSPLALLALAAVPTVLGIYLFRTRARRREVSSLFLWVDQFQARQGGRRMQKLQMPLLLLLELLVLTLLALAAAGPNIRNEQVNHSTVVILDASFSMTSKAGEDVETPQELAIKDLNSFFESGAGYPIQFVLASEKPEVLSGKAHNAIEAKEILKQWKCGAPTASISAALSLAGNIASSDAKFIVVTDHAPAEGDIEPGRLIWKAFGTSLDNVAIIHASRVFQGDKDRLLIEIKNLPKDEKSKKFQMSLLEQGKGVLTRVEETIEPNETFRLRYTIPEGIGTLEARLGPDALNIDNRVVLLPPNRRPVRVMIGSLPADIHDSLKRAIESSGIGTIVTERPEILFTSRGHTGTESHEHATTETSADESSDSNTPNLVMWTVRFVTSSEEEIKSFIGPFVIDRSNPVTNGLTLEGTVWGASENTSMGGFPIISAGNTPLITELIRRNSARDINFQLNDRYSTLTNSPAWPILIWNLLKYRMDQSHGIPDNNIRLGSEAVFLGTPDDRTVQVTSPNGEKKNYPVRNMMLPIPANEVGLYNVNAPSGKYAFAVAALSVEESNISKASSGMFGGWMDEDTLRSDFHSIVWALLLTALIILSVHLIILCGRPNN